MQVQCLAEPNYAMQCKRFGVRGRVTSRAEICDKVSFCLCNQQPYGGARGRSGRRATKPEDGEWLSAHVRPGDGDAATTDAPPDGGDRWSPDEAQHAQDMPPVLAHPFRSPNVRKGTSPMIQRSTANDAVISAMTSGTLPVRSKTPFSCFRMCLC